MTLMKSRKYKTFASQYHQSCIMRTLSFVPQLYLGHTFYYDHLSYMAFYGFSKIDSSLLCTHRLTVGPTDILNIPSLWLNHKQPSTRTTYRV